MKKDNDLSISKSGSTDKQNSDSTTLTLQKLNKETEKKEAAAEAMRVRCKACFRETAPQRKCGGHGGSAASEEANNSDENTIQDSDKSNKQDEKRVDLDIIAKLIDSELLVIQINPTMFSIELKCFPNGLTEKQKAEYDKYVTAILEEWEAFREEHHLSKDRLKETQDNDGNIKIVITLPTQALYNAFVQRLANNLSPTSEPQLQTRDNHNTQLPSPKPTPRKSAEDDEETKIFNPTPTSIIPKP